jgi:hypothetical protein
MPGRLVVLYLSANPCSVPPRVMLGALHYYHMRLRWSAALPCSDLFRAASSGDARRGARGGTARGGQGTRGARSSRRVDDVDVASGLDSETAAAIARRLAGMRWRMLTYAHELSGG